MYRLYNPNPECSRVGDCTVRALSKVLNQSWEQTYLRLCVYGFLHSDMPSANVVWGAYLHDCGFSRHIVPDTIYTVRRFAEEHPVGVYVLGISGHVVALVNGDWFDSWDSGDEVPVYFWRKES